MGETPIRLRRVMLRILSGVNRDAAAVPVPSMVWMMLMV
jgi:hypothetical protein